MIYAKFGPCFWRGIIFFLYFSPSCRPTDDVLILRAYRGDWWCVDITPYIMLFYTLPGVCVSSSSLSVKHHAGFVSMPLSSAVLEWSAMQATTLQGGYSRLQKSCNKQAEQWKTTIRTWLWFFTVFHSCPDPEQKTEWGLDKRVNWGGGRGQMLIQHTNRRLGKHAKWQWPLN